jgi:hypothetical protein
MAPAAMTPLALLWPASRTPICPPSAVGIRFV